MPSFPSCSVFVSSTLVFVHPRLGVKECLEVVPDIGLVCPPHCPGCGAGSRPSGARVVLVGHGVRRRRLVWKTGRGNEMRQDRIFVRRFLCVLCGVTITVLPRTVAPRRHYAFDVIVWCLAVWGLGEATAYELRALFCDEPHLDWPQLRRWAYGVPIGRRRGRGPPRVEAMRVAQIAAGHAPPASREGTSLAQRAFLGAAYMR